MEVCSVAVVRAREGAHRRRGDRRGWAQLDRCRDQHGRQRRRAAPTVRLTVRPKDGFRDAEGFRVTGCDYDA